MREAYGIQFRKNSYWEGPEGLISSDDDDVSRPRVQSDVKVVDANVSDLELSAQKKNYSFSGSAFNNFQKVLKPPI